MANMRVNKLAAVAASVTIVAFLSGCGSESSAESAAAPATTTTTVAPTTTTELPAPVTTTTEAAPPPPPVEPEPIPTLKRLAEAFLEHPKSAPTLHVTWTLTGLDVDVTVRAVPSR